MSNMTRLMFGLVIAGALAGTAYAAHDCTPSLDAELFCHPAVDGEVYTSIVWNDGTGEKLYIAGAFTTVGCLPVQNIACWDGSSWSALGDGLTGGTNSASGRRVETLAIYDDGNGEALYAGGTFQAADGDLTLNYLAKWNGSQWSQVGGGVNGVVRALGAFDIGNGPVLFVAGNSLNPAGLEIDHITGWDGSQWSALGPGLDNDVLALGVYDDGNGPDLYAGGFFSGTGEQDIAHLARWDGSAWSQVGGGIPYDNFIRAVATITTHDDGSGEALYIGGQFLTSVGGVEVDGAARWDGSSWSALPELDKLPDTALSVSDLRSIDDGNGSILYATGRFGISGTDSVNAAGLQNGQWNPLGSGLNDYGWTISGLSTEGGMELFVGGGFTEAGGIHTGGLARWQKDSWSPINADSGLNDRVLAMVRFTHDNSASLVVGGAFTGARNPDADRIALFDGQAWSPLNNGLNNVVSAVTQVDLGDGPSLFAGGTFTMAGNSPINRIARWDGQVWQPLAGPGGNGTNSVVNALIGFDDDGGTDLYATGNFTTAGGVSASAIARWDGDEWSALTGSSGSSFNGAGRALAVFDDGSGPALYVGGSFTTAGGISANRVARWDGSEWSALVDGGGNGLNSTVYALAVYDDGSGPALYAGGNFSQAGGQIASGVARWDGVNWSQISADAFDGSVFALEAFDDASGSALYIGGNFTQIGSTEAERIARWDGATLSPFDLSFDRAVYAFEAVYEGDETALYIGGDFTQATTADGTSPKLRIAKWTGCPESICPPDVTGDGNINLADLNLVLANFGQTTPDGDTNDDGQVNLADLNAILAAFGQTCP